MYMKVAQNDETNPDKQPVRPPRIPSIANTQLSPPVHLSGNAKHRGYFPGCFPPSPVSPTTTIGHTYHHAMSCHASSCICLHCIYCFSPFFSLVDYGTDVAAGTPVVDYGVDDPSLPEQPGKPPLDHQISPILLYTACIRVV